jgi:hypothetical protein
VLEVDFAAGRATVKLVPRLDLAGMASDQRSGARAAACGVLLVRLVVVARLSGQRARARRARGRPHKLAWRRMCASPTHGRPLPSPHTHTHTGVSRRNAFGRQAVRPQARPFRAKEAIELGLPVGKDKNDSNVVALNTHRCVAPARALVGVRQAGPGAPAAATLYVPVACTYRSRAP